MGGLVLLTGATGFLGAQIARRLVNATDLRVLCLVRGPDAESARTRLERAFFDWPELRDAMHNRIEVLRGDVAEPKLGLSDDAYRRLVKQLTHIVHAAADLRLAALADDLRPTNVVGVRHIVELALAAHADHGLQRLAHISTAYVAGRRTGTIDEQSLSGEAGFLNGYEQTKFEGESVVDGVRDQLPVSIFRPGMIVGDSQTGAVRTFNTFYYPVRRYLMDGARIIPATRNLRVNIVPVDYVADAVEQLTLDPAAAGLTFHLTAPTAALPAAGQVVEAIRTFARTALGVRLPQPLWIGTRLAGSVGRLVDRRVELLPYFNEKREFSRDNIDRLLGPYSLDWRLFFPRLLAYATDRGFVHHADRTVHETVLSRLESHRGRVTFNDIVAGRAVRRSAAEVHGEILAAVSSLRARGVRKGSRVAIVGVNSTRYLSLDIAIGLCGAVSVPIYYTSPPEEVDAILRSSRAELLLVGAPAILARLDEVSTAIPIVSFWRLPPPPGLRGRVMGWDEFLASGSGMPSTDRAAVGFGDLATLRYTSGTTGPPKGVAFTHGQLRWMAQTVIALLPWGTRCGDNRYLSFLPLNHVVEGILCNYAAYRLPGRTSIWFLEDFRALATMLPRVRPSIFFGVPRIYEKAMDQLSGNPLGRRLLARPSGLAGRALRLLALRRMGLDRCAQLIVGSAPIANALLEAYARAGIAIHNAYGLTEAPLIALNRLGRNRIGTVGEPLPDTQVRISAEGEILVRGPQVTSGYDDRALASPLENGWLHTGDLGELTEDGYLLVTGRLKQLIVTSYAKKVSPEKVEALLRGIPGVDEAMLVGDGRPYCAALLWADATHGDQASMAAIDRGVAAVNAELAPPERARRWAILRNDLSIERGDLTANLKPRRAVLQQRFTDAIDQLYPAASGGTAA